MYEGSLVGKGPVVFAVMGYVIANQKPDRQLGSQVRLNAVLLATIIGTERKEIEKAIDFLCAPDAESTTPDNEGRRLVRVGQFDYQVVNGAKYLAIRDEEVRREQNRVAQAKHREAVNKCAKKPRRKTAKQIRGDMDAAERRYVKAEDNGDQAYADKIAAGEA